MIRISIDLISANSGDVTRLGVMHIANDGKGSDRIASYDGKVWRKPDFKEVTRTGHVPNWPRKSKTIWHLVAMMLFNMGYVK